MNTTPKLLGWARSLQTVEEAGDLGSSLPGGWVDVGESPTEAVEREVLEDSHHGDPSLPTDFD